MMRINRAMAATLTALVLVGGCSSSKEQDKPSATTLLPRDVDSQATPGTDADDTVVGDDAGSDVRQPSTSADDEASATDDAPVAPPGDSGRLADCGTSGTCGSTDLKGSRIEMAQYDGMDLRGANLALATIEGAVSMRGADLTGANLRDAALHGVDLTGANLTRANFTDATLIDVDLREANMTDTVLDGVMWCRVSMPDGTQRNDDC